VWNDLDGFENAGGVLANESTNGFIGGGQVGYNWQFRHAVVGIETDFDYLSLNQSTRLFALPAGNVGPTLHDSIQWLGTVRGRAGLAIDNVLTYLTAGLAYGSTRHTNVHPFFNVDPNFNLSSTKVGFVAGVGAEYALDPRWSIKPRCCTLISERTRLPLQVLRNRRRPVTQRQPRAASIYWTRCGFSAPA
jgi:outer membrane immunogenic protein